MNPIEFRRSEPENIETEVVVVTKFENSVSGDYDLLRGIKISMANNNFLDGKNFHSDCEYIFEISLSLHYNYNFNNFNVEYYKQALSDCVFYAKSDELKSIALPLITFDRHIQDPFLEDFDDSIEFTFDLGLEIISWNQKPINIVFYTNDESLDVEELKNRFINYICNSYLKSYESKDVNHDSKKSDDNECDFFDDRLKDIHLPLETFIEKYSGKAFDEFVNDYLNSSKIKGSDLYKQAQISKQDYHKMMTNPSLPAKQEKQKYDTVALLLSSNPDINRFNEMLASRGFALSDCRTKDLIIKYYIMNGNCKISEINEELERRNLPIIGNSLI